MANVLFKRGLQNALPANGSAQDGVLYFTTDSKRLFLGMPNGDRIPIAEGITSVTSVSNLPEASANHAGEFYYASEGNILAYCTGSAWLQVNLSSQVTSLTQAATVTNSSGTVALTLSQSGGGEGEKATSFVLTASDNVHIAAGTASNELVLSADDTTYTLATSTTTTTNAAKITLTPSTGSVQAFEVIGKNGVTITRSGTNIELAVDSSEVGAISSFSMGPGNNEASSATTTSGFHGIIKDAGNHEYVGAFDPIIVYGNNGNESVHFNGGTATINAYTISQVDGLLNSLKKTLDAVTYRGTADSAASLTTSEGVHNGDAWKANAEFTIGTTTVPIGALIIAKGTEVDGVIPTADVTYDIITGDQADTTYSFSGTTHGVILKASTGDESSSFALASNSDQLVLSDSGSETAKTVSIALATVTTSSTSGTAISQSSGGTASITAVTGVSTDSYGRVTGVEKTSFSVVDTVLSATRTTTVTTTSNVATITDVVKDSASNEASSTRSIGSSGQSITVTSSGNAINLDLVWGSF